MHNINPHQSGMAPESALRRMLAIHSGQGRRPGSIAGDGVQEHSKGELYPAVISTVESYLEWESLPVAVKAGRRVFDGIVYTREDYYSQVSLERRLRYVAHRLTLDGHSEDYSEYAEAEQVARVLLVSQPARDAWRRGDIQGV